MAATGTGIGQRDVAHLEHRNHTNIGLSNHKVCTRAAACPAVFFPPIAAFRRCIHHRAPLRGSASL